MKLLKQFSDEIEAESFSEKLRNKGLMTYISSKRSMSFGRHQTGALTVGVWVVLENQYEDAFELMKNKNHKPSNSLSVEEIEKLESKLKISLSGSIKKGLTKTLNILAVITLFSLVLIVAYQVIRSNYA